MTDKEFREAAEAQYGKDGAIELDGNAIVSRGSDNGAYVAAWVWVADDHPSEDDAGDDDSFFEKVEDIDSGSLMCVYCDARGGHSTATCAACPFCIPDSQGAKEAP